MSMWKCARPGFSALIVGFFLCSAPAVPAMAGQGAANPAGITGVVTDNTGAILPGVTVTATSPALQVPSVTSVSDERGEYRLSPLPIGVYTVLFELPGFQNVRREGVRLTVGFTARVDAEMNVGAVSETITVSGASPLVDTTSTATSTELTREQLEVLPTSRDGFHAFMNQVPGVRTNLDVGSSGLGDTVEFRLYGQLGSPWQMVEGVLASAPTLLGAQGSHVDFNAIDGTRVQTVGSNAEMPRRGLLVDSVIKSGGNDFHGTAVVYGSGGGTRGRQHRRHPRGAGHQAGEAAHGAGLRRHRGRPDRPEQALVFRRRPVSESRTRHPGRVRSRRHADHEYQGGRVLLWQRSRIRRRPAIASPASTTGPTITNCGMRAGSSRGNRWKRRTIRSRSRRANGKPCAAMRWSPRSSTGDGTSGAPVTAAPRARCRRPTSGRCS